MGNAAREIGLPARIARASAWLVLCLGLVAAMPARATESPQAREAAARASPLATTFDRFVIRFRAGSPGHAQAGARRDALAAIGRQADVRFTELHPLAVGGQVWRAHRRLDAAAAQRVLQRLRAHPQVERAELDGWYRPAMVPTDPYYAGNQWHYYEEPGGIRAPAAWDLATGTGIVVAVLDTGVLLAHPDLAANIVPGYDFITDPFMGNDGTGRDADAGDPGDWATAGQCFTGSPATNSSWHGTHVAGTVAAATNNGVGAAGVAFNAKIQPVRILGRCGGNGADIADAIVWAAGGGVTGVPANPTPAEVINLSLTASGACPGFLQDAIDFAHAQGVVVVTAAGNFAVDAAGYNPGSCNHVVNVGASNRTAGRASYSNYGEAVDVTGPGGDGGITTGMVHSTGNTGTTTPSSHWYTHSQGTSMAAPHVSGIAALMQSRNVNTPTTVAAILEATARPLDAATCFPGCNAPLVDAAMAVRAADGPMLFMREVVVEEGHSGTKTVTVTLQLSQPLAQTITFDVATANGTATAGSDYVARTYAGRTLAPGALSRTFTFTVNGDTTPEADETFLVNVTNITGATIAPASGTVTLRNDDPVPLVNREYSQPFSGAKGRQWVFELDVPANRGTILTLINFGGLDLYARWGAMPTTTVYDCRASTPPCNLPAGAGKMYVLAVANSDVTNTMVYAGYVPGIVVQNAEAAEGDSGTSTITIPVTIDLPQSVAVSANINTVFGTANQYDIEYRSATVTIPAGEVRADFVVQLVEDTVVEPNETFEAFATSPTNAMLSDNTGVGTVLNDDGPTFVVSDVATEEWGSMFYPGAVPFHIELTELATVETRVDWGTASGTASEGSDFQLAQGTVVIPAGQWGTTVQVPLYNDSVVEPNEYFSVYLSNAVNATIQDSLGVATILNDDGPTLAVGIASIAEGQSGTRQLNVPIYLSQAAAGKVTVVASTSSDEATAGSDYVARSATVTIPAGQTSANFAVTINGDTAAEPNEEFKVTLTNASGATIRSAVGRPVILNDDGAFVTINDVTITEGNSGTKSAVFTVSLSELVASPVEVSIGSVSDMAIVEDDLGTVWEPGLEIPAGTYSRTFSVPVHGDTQVEANETFKVIISDVYGDATLLDDTGIGTILNDDGPRLTIGDASIGEGNGGTTTLVFPVQLAQAAPGTVSVTVRTDGTGTATAGSDYVARTATLTIPAGKTKVNFAVSLNGDTVVEANEKLYAEITAASGASIYDARATGTVLNDDGPTLSINNFSVPEGNSGTRLATFTVSLSQAAGVPVTYNIATAPGTANGADYVSRSLVGETIPAGQTSRTFSVTINGDTAKEANETILANLTSATNATVFDAQGQATILNDDGPRLSINNASVSEGNSGTKTLTFIVSTPVAATGPITFDLDSVAGTATSPSDFQAVDAPGVVLPAGMLSIAVPVTINGDVAVEGNETFTLKIVGATGATILDGAGVGTITNDD